MPPKNEKIIVDLPKYRKAVEKLWRDVRPRKKLQQQKVEGENGNRDLKEI